MTTLADEIRSEVRRRKREAARRRQARHIAKRIAGTPAQRCAYKRCNKLFIPTRAKSRYCSISCAQTVVSLKRHGCVE